MHLVWLHIWGADCAKCPNLFRGKQQNLMGVLGQIFQGIRQVQAYGMETHEKRRASQAVMSVRHLNIKAARIGNFINPD